MDANFRNRATLDLPMRMAQHDPTNVQTLDVSPTGAHAQLGDGSTAATYPTKRNYQRGYDFDGADYLLVPDEADLRIGTGEFYLGVLVRRTTTAATKVLVSKGLTAAGEWMLDFGSPSSVIRFYGGAGDISASWNSGDDTFWNRAYHSVICTRRGSGVYLYVDGELRASDTSAGSDLSTEDDISIGAGSEGTDRFYTGWIGQVIMSTSECLSSLQVMDLHLSMMKRIEAV